MIERTRNSGRRRRATITCLPLVVAAVIMAALAVLPAAGLTLNHAMLDDGTCGHNLQFGSDPTASSSNTPWFLLAADGGLASYAMSIDGAAIGTFNSNPYGHVCISTTTALSEGAHQLTGNELKPNPSNAVTPFSFTVDTIAPAPPSTPTLDPNTDSGVKGDNITSSTSIRLDGTGVPGISIHVLEAGKMATGTVADSTGHWSAMTMSLTNGAHTLCAVAMDQASNLSQPSGSLTVTIDPNAPTASTTTTTVSSTTTTASTTTTMPATTTTTKSTTTTTLATTTTTAPPTTTSTTLAARLPGAPTNVTAGSSGKNIRVSWSAASNGGSAITSYVVYRGTTSGTETQFTSVSGTSLSFTDSNVARRVPYYYRVSARNAIGAGPLSTEVSASSK
jgi:hypothetical protein